jgi:hypothetical protein
MKGFRASEWGNEGFLKDDGKDGLSLPFAPRQSSHWQTKRDKARRDIPGFALTVA